MSSNIIKFTMMRFLLYIFLFRWNTTCTSRTMKIPSSMCSIRSYNRSFSYAFWSLSCLFNHSLFFFMIHYFLMIIIGHHLSMTTLSTWHHIFIINSFINQIRFYYCCICLINNILTLH